MRKLKGFYKYFIYILGIITVLYTVSSITVIPRDPWIFRAVHLTFTLIMIFWLVPPKKNDETLKQEKPLIVDIVLSILSLAVLLYIIAEFDELIYRVGAIPTQMDIVIGIVLILVVLEATRRAAGMSFVIVALVFIAYTFLGKYLPGILAHKGYSIDRTVSYIFSTEGIYGSTLMASASFAILFISLGSFFKGFGADEFFNKFAMAVSGHTRGGPGKVAVLASALFGTVSGHAAGNVATTGTFTIPMMKRIGYKPSFAGGVEAASSTGGQFLPPIMGSVIFVMIELTGITYSKLIVAAALPAILYYIAIFLMVDFEAINLNLRGIPRSELPSVRESMKYGYAFIVSIAVLLYFLFVQKSSVSLAAVYTIISVIVVGALSLRDVKRIGKKILDCLYNGAVGTMKLAPLTAAAGIVIGVVTLTGIGLKLGRFLIAISGGELFFVLIFSMILSLVLGMGMSTIPAYVIAATVVAPALVELGIPMLQAHLFVLYYACISTITPPIAISSFTAAGIADADPMETSFKAVKLAIIGFMVPFLFVYRPALLAQGSTSTIIYAIIISLIAIYSLSRGLQLRTISIVERILLVGGSLVLLLPKNDIIGVSLIAVSYAMSFIKFQKRSRAKEM
ncbi:MAG: TRAP transporter permease [Dehalobacterium sp.]